MLQRRKGNTFLISKCLDAAATWDKSYSAEKAITFSANKTKRSFFSSVLQSTFCKNAEKLENN